MPGMDGIDVLKQLKQSDSNVEVIMITGHGDMEIAVQCLQHDASDFIAKPLQRAALEVALKRAKERLAMKRQLQDYTRNLESKVREATMELARSCERLRTLYEISQLVAETPSLSGITQLLKERIEALTHFDCHAFLLLNSRRSGLVRGRFDDAAVAVPDDLADLIQDLEKPLFLEAADMRRIFPESPDSAHTFDRPVPPRADGGTARRRRADRAQSSRHGRRTPDHEHVAVALGGHHPPGRGPGGGSRLPPAEWRATSDSETWWEGMRRSNGSTG